MARNTKAPVQQYRGTTAQHANYTGAVGEITVDTTKKTAVVHDGVTKGGFPLAKESVKIQAGESITVTGGTLAGNNTIAAKIGSKAQRGVLQVGDNIDVSNGVISTLNWTDEVETLTASNSEEISDAMHDNGLLYVSGENTTVVGRAIGELAWSLLPIRSAGYHLLDGSLIYSTGIYAAFYNYMVQLKNSGSADAAFCTETEWQNSVTNYGVCGKFVLNTTNGTVRLPKVTGHVEGTIDAAALGDLIEAGLPNIKSNGVFGIGISSDSTDPTSALYIDGNTNNLYGSGGNVDRNMAFDASRSSAVYGNSTTVQTQSIKGFIYIIVGTYAKTDLQVNIDNVAADLQKKTDAAAAAHAAMPSNKYVALEVPAENGGTITAPSDGYIQLSCTTSAIGGWVRLQSDITGLAVSNQIALQDADIQLHLPVFAGDIVHIVWNGIIFNSLGFIYCNGSAPSA